MSEPTTVQEKVVLPVSVLQILLTIAGAGVSVFLTKHSLVATADEEPRNTHAENSICGFVSVVHMLSVVHATFFLLFSVALLFNTSVVNSSVSGRSCFLASVFAAIGFIGSKASLYAFMTARLEYIFRGTDLALDAETIRRIGGIVGVYVTSISVISAIGLSSGGNMVKTLNTGSRSVCVLIQSEVDGFAVFGALMFLATDTIVMGTVAYGFLHRLFKLAAQNMHEDVRMLAFQTVLLSLITMVASVVIVLIVLLYPHNLSASWIPHLEALINIIAVYLAQHHVFNSGWLMEKQWTVEMMGTKVKTEIAAGDAVE